MRGALKKLWREKVMSRMENVYESVSCEELGKGLEEREMYKYTLVNYVGNLNEHESCRV